VNSNARFCNRCGEPITPPDVPAPRQRNPLPWLIPLTLVLAVAILALLWQVVFGGGLHELLPGIKTTPTFVEIHLPTATLAPTATSPNQLIPTSTVGESTPVMQPSATLASLFPSPGQPAESPTPGPSPTPSPYGRVAGTDGELLNVRTGPGVEYEIAVQLEEGATVVLLGRDATDTWLRIRTPSGLQGWVARQYIINDVPSDHLPVFTPEPTPLPTATLLGDPRFVADRYAIAPGECARLQWSVDNVRSVFLEGSGVAGHGTLDVCPTETKTYTLQVVDNEGAARDWTVTITVAETTNAAWALAYRGCIAHDMELGQVKGQVLFQDGRVIQNALVEITVDG